MMQQGFQPKLTTSNILSGLGGLFVVLLYFAPWVSTIGMSISGNVIASVASTLGGNFGWLIVIPLLGAGATGLALFNMIMPPATGKGRVIAMVILGGTTFAILGIAALNINDAVSTANSLGSLFGVQVARLGLGIIGSLLAAAAVAAGGLMDLFASSVTLPTIAAAPTASGRQPAMYRPQAIPGAPSSGRPSARLAVRSGPLANQTFPITSESLLIGRGSDCDLRLDDRAVSRQHARIRYAQGAWFIQDQDSSGGTFVNGRPQKATRLNAGDKIQIGGSTLIFYPEE